MERGYVKLWRKTMDSGLLQNGPAWQLFGYLLLKAAHKPVTVVVGGRGVKMGCGQCIFGRLKAANDLGLSERKIRTALKLLENMEIVTTEATNKFTIIKFMNWADYQIERPAGDRPYGQQTTSKRPAGDHIQECKNNTKTESKDSVVDATASTPEQLTLQVEAKAEPKARAKNSVPPCPHQQILDMYHELLPVLPRMKVWDKARKGNMGARWRERWEAKAFSSQAEGMDYFRRMFEYVGRECDFLMGRVTDRDGKPFFASLDWIAMPKNFAKIIEGKYSRREAA